MIAQNQIFLLDDQGVTLIGQGKVGLVHDLLCLFVTRLEPLPPPPNAS